MKDRIVAALPAIGGVFGIVVYYPYLYFFLEFHENVPFYSEVYEKIEVTTFQYENEKIKESYTDRYGVVYQAPKCSYQGPTLYNPIFKNEKLIKEKVFDTASGRGTPIVILEGSVPIYVTDYKFYCTHKITSKMLPKPNGAVKFLPGTIDHIESYVEVDNSNRRIVGFVEKQKVRFEKPFRVMDFVQWFSVLGAWISLVYLFKYKESGS